MAIEEVGEVIPLLKETAVRVSDLRYDYPDGTVALRGIDLSIARGESVAVVGPNGAGKSTLALHLNGILRGESTVEIMGVPVNKKNLKKIRSMVGMVFQDPEDQLFSPTVGEDVAFGPRNMRLEESQVNFLVQRALAWVGLDGFEDRSPHHLSYGEKKRVSLATVLSMDPDILVLDEPTSNLDPRGVRGLIELIGSLPLTLVLVTHDLDLARRLCSRVYILDGGRIVKEGALLDLLQDRELLTRHGLL